MYLQQNVWGHSMMSAEVAKRSANRDENSYLAGFLYMIWFL